jgi:hypothetical protein
MSVESYNLDQIMALMGDTFDGAITPRRIFRDNKNRVWLLFQGIAAGFRLINDMVVSLKSKFDPANCTDEDLQSTALLVGTKFKNGKSSFVQINFTNNDTVASHDILAGDYLFVSTGGQSFRMTLDADVTVAASGVAMMIFASDDKGAFAVGAGSNAQVSRVDLSSIDPNFSFSTLSNARYLGYLDEDAFDFRVRILNDTNRQDAIAELELAVRNLPEILEANLFFNPSGTDAVIDGITVPPFNLLVVVTGFPALSMAQTIIAKTMYLTVEVDPADTLNIVDSHFSGGVFPVHYTKHQYTDFELTITYRFDGNKIVQANAESAMSVALNGKWHQGSQYVETLTVGDVFELLESLNLTSVQPLQIDMMLGITPVFFIDFLKTRLPNLSNISFVGINTSS